VLAISFFLFGKYMAVFVPSLFAVLTIAVVYLIASRLYSKTHGLVAALILACCPLWLFFSMRIWIETMVIFLTVFSFYFVMLACDKKQFRWFFYSGVVFGLALLTKQIAVFIIPAIIYYVVRQKVSIRDRFCFLFVFFSTAIVINIPWLMFYYKMMGTLSYANQYQHTQAMLRMFPSIQVTVGRPWYYYFLNLPIIYPMYILSFVGIFLTIKRRQDLTLVIWSVTVLLVYTILGGDFFNINLSYTMRFIALALPALAITASDVCCDMLSRPKLINQNCIILMVFLAYGIGLGLLNYHDSGTIDTTDPSMVLQYLGK
jgi:4-amino-4-deoxy-L-arabinose transferase-like glycosyltransferase